MRAERFEKAVAKQRNSRWLFRRPCACRRARKRAERMNHLRQKSRRLFADGIFYWCGRRDSKRRLRSKETAGGCFGGRVRVGERESEPSESRNPLHKKKGTATPFLFNFNLFSFSAVLISGRIISYPYMASFSLPSRAYSPALRGQLKARFPAPHPLWCCLRR